MEPSSQQPGQLLIGEGFVAEGAEAAHVNPE